MAEGFTVELVSGSAGWPAVSALRPLVYPPEQAATEVGRDVDWAHAELRLLTKNTEGQLVSALGMFFRKVTHGARIWSVGGIGGVMTHPAYRRCGLAGAALAWAHDYFVEEAKTDFAFLVCEPKNFSFYEGLGWRHFKGPVQVDQPQGHVLFTAMSPMVRDVLQPAPTDGPIDLCGKPW